MKTCRPLKGEDLRATLDSLSKARVALIGDICLDMYLSVDMRLSQLSRETPHFNLPVVGERFSPGGAGNAVNNIAALKPASVTALGAVGNDWRGAELLKALEQAGVNTDGVLRSDELTTNTYLKVIRRGISDVAYEDPRIDFENRSALPAHLEDKLCEALDAAEYDVLLVSDQMEFGCITPKVRTHICEIAKAGKPVIVDSRYRIADYEYCIVKPNEVEAARAYGDGSVPEDICAFAASILPEISKRNHAPAIVTLGDKGCMCFDGELFYCPARSVTPPIDIVGAGDTFLAAVGTSVAAGLEFERALRIATLASGVTVKKIGTTGTATREEIAQAAED